MEEMVEITKKQYEELQDAQAFLLALQAAGVDNWDGYDYAIDILEEWSNE
jgi:hypothetical protein